MAVTSTTVRIADGMYNPDGFLSSTSAPLHSSSASSTVRWDAPKQTQIVRYIAPRTFEFNAPKSERGIVRGNAWLNVGSTTSMKKSSSNTGLSSLVQSTTITNVPSVHHVEGEHLEERRELSFLTDTLGDAILQCYYLGGYNSILKTQLDWLSSRQNQNSSIIQSMYLQEMESARNLGENARRDRTNLERKINDAQQATKNLDQRYQQLLTKRHGFGSEIFQFQRQIAQNLAEAYLIRQRVRDLDDESKFYLLKNNSLQARQMKLRTELDEELFSRQTLQSERDVLEAEKITNEDMRIASLDGIRGSINVALIAGMQPSIYFREQIAQEILSIRRDHEKRLEGYREQWQRKFELEYHRFQIFKNRPIPQVTREHDLQLDQYRLQKKEVDQQIASVRGRENEIQIQIQTIEYQIRQASQNRDTTFTLQQRLNAFNKIILEKEEQVRDVLQIRGSLKRQVEKFKEEIKRYGRTMPPTYEITEKIYDTYGTLNLTPSSQYSSSIAINNYNERRQQSAAPQPSLPAYRARSVSPSRRIERTVITGTEGSTEQGTLFRYADFNVEQDCEELRAAMKGLGTHDSTLIRIMGSRNTAQRLQIRDTFKIRFGRDLVKDFESETSGNFRKLLKMLTYSPAERDCYELRRVLEGKMIDVTVIVEILMSRSNKQIRAISDMYLKSFKETLERDIIADRISQSKKILVALLQARRPETNEINHREALNDARELYNAGVRKWRTDDSLFIQFLCNRSNAQLKQIFDVYRDFSRSDIEQVIKAETSEDLSRTLTAIVRIVRNRPRFFAYELKKSLKGIGTNEDNLNRIIVTRCEIDMIQIKEEYENITKRSLHSHIDHDTSGSYRQLLLELLAQRTESIVDNSQPRLPNISSGFVTSTGASQLQRSWGEPINRIKPGTATTTSIIGRSSSTEDMPATIVNANVRRNFDSSYSSFDRNNQGKKETMFTMTPKSSAMGRRQLSSKPSNILNTPLRSTDDGVYDTMNQH